MAKSLVQFAYADVPLKLNNKRKVQQFVEFVFSNEAVRLAALKYVFCSDIFLLDINQQFLNHDEYTDIITFDLSEDRALGVIGEIYISVERVADNAKKFKVSLEQEVLRVIFHGALHLCGFGDKTKREISLMRMKEEQYLRLYMH